ncbi:MAG: oxygen-independent coproporphyrinogen III oxidase, partial [Streptococcaceae bacterium]|nr:oxygen-independent coproporphyrinogen III oxidase [Streptococcaceae bacterium]
GPIQHYLSPLRVGKLPIVETTQLTKNNQMEEEMFLGLRKIKGVFKQTFQEKFGISYEEVYGEVTKKLIRDGLIEDKDGFITMSEKGLFVGNLVFEEFLLND